MEKGERENFKERLKRDPDLRAMVRKIALIILSVLLVFAFAIAHLFPRKRAAYALPARGEGEMRLHFLDVGQGDCAAVEFPEGTLMLVDAGNGSRENNLRIERYLAGLSYERLVLVCTHADSDHCGGFRAVIERFGAEKLYLPAVAAQSECYLGMIGAAEKSGVAMEPMARYAGDTLAGAYYSCISPYSQGETDENDSSAVLMVGYAGVDALFCGDITASRERLLYEEYRLFDGIFDADGRTVRLEETEILKVAHHGSDSSSDEDWLGLLGAETAVLSCGRGNRYAHPAAGAVARLRESGAQIYRTDELGCVMIVISPDGTYRTEWGYL